MYNVSWQGLTVVALSCVSVARLNSISQNVTLCMFPVRLHHKRDSHVRFGRPKRSGSCCCWSPGSPWWCDVGARPELLHLLDLPSASLTPEPVCVRSMMKDVSFFCRRAYHRGQKQPRLQRVLMGPALFLLYPVLHPPSLPTACPADFDF